MDLGAEWGAMRACPPPPPTVIGENVNGKGPKKFLEHLTAPHLKNIPESITGYTLICFQLSKGNTHLTLDCSNSRFLETLFIANGTLRNQIFSLHFEKFNQK